MSLPANCTKAASSDSMTGMRDMSFASKDAIKAQRNAMEKQRAATDDVFDTLERMSLRCESTAFFNVLTPNENFAGRREELEKLDFLIKEPHKGPFRSVIVHGPPGIGKTQLARQYAHKYWKGEDKDVVWVNARSPRSIYQSLFDAANDLHLKDSRFFQSNCDSLEIFEAINGKLQDRDRLFIFDHLTSYETINFLFTNCSLMDLPKVLVTTCYIGAPRVCNPKFLNLPQLDTLDAVEFFKKSFEITVPDHDDDIHSLCIKLGCFPQTLAQAVAYIEGRRSKDKNYFIQEFLGDYDENDEEKMNFFKISDF